MFAILAAILIVAVVIDAFLSVSVIYHLRQYSLPGWTLTKIIIPLYLALSAAALASAVWWLMIIKGLP